MRRNCILIVALLAIVTVLGAAPQKRKSITFGKELPVKLFLGPAEDRTSDIQVRALMVNGEIREFTTGEPHEVTERTFVVRRAYRLNDLLPDEPQKKIQWKWQLGDWLMVDRHTGRVSRLTLPLFDPFYSEATWFRDYAAYCGLSDDAGQVYAMVAQLGQKKPLLRKLLAPASGGDDPASECAAPSWQRQPTRVTFHPKNSRAVQFAIHGRNADPDPVEEPREEPAGENTR
jgi:hypothetical protein